MIAISVVCKKLQLKLVANVASNVHSDKGIIRGIIIIYSCKESTAAQNKVVSHKSRTTVN